MEYSLIIDDIKQDQIKGLYGILVLHGMLDDDGNKKPLKVIVKQTLLTSRFYCKIDGKIYEMESFKIDEF
ncbi:MAG: hypothetical protein U9N08_04185 [Candidatus Caldatribacteriota bacterium]|nr:hypothetical protein [Candidatus Caldatribacteriota bacterium]